MTRRDATCREEKTNPFLYEKMVRSGVGEWRGSSGPKRKGAAAGGNDAGVMTTDGKCGFAKCTELSKASKDPDDRKRARAMLRCAASLAVHGVMRARNWLVPTMVEFLPRNQGLLGININKGQRIKVRLRNDSGFLPFVSILGTVLHGAHCYHSESHRKCPAPRPPTNLSSDACDADVFLVLFIYNCGRQSSYITKSARTTSTSTNCWIRSGRRSRLCRCVCARTSREHKLALPDGRR